MPGQTIEDIARAEAVFLGDDVAPLEADLRRRFPRARLMPAQTGLAALIAHVVDLKFFCGFTFAENGRNPSGLVKEAGAFNCDLFWDGSGWDNSFEQPGAKTFPRILPNQAWPDVFRRAYTRSFVWLRDRMM